MDGKIVVVTGAGSGIGRRVAQALAQDGAFVVLAGRKFEALEETIGTSGLDESRFLPVATDVRDPAAVDRLFQSAMEKFGRIDVLFNNAGIFDPGPLEDVTAERWQSIIDVNLNGAFYCAQAAYRAMKQQSPQGGRIINNGSVSAHSPRPNAVGYTVAKHAITGLTKSISLEGRPYDIACGQIDIGNAATDMTDGMSKGVLQADGSVRPEPTMNIENVVKAVRFMAGLSLDANVQFMTVMATAMPFIGRG
jgi:NAD(P)-dependent dehydrogenase (short-subunit alcohol dehydrogenase family)